jgi:hypothetical protein
VRKVACPVSDAQPDKAGPAARMSVRAKTRDSNPLTPTVTTTQIVSRSFARQPLCYTASSRRVNQFRSRHPACGR